MWQELERGGAKEGEWVYVGEGGWMVGLGWDGGMWSSDYFYYIGNPPRRGSRLALTGDGWALQG